jgi:hypothetical protein
VTPADRGGVWRRAQRRAWRGTAARSHPATPSRRPTPEQEEKLRSELDRRFAPRNT